MMVIELVNTLVRRSVAGWARVAQRGVSCRALMLCTAENWFAHPFFLASFDVKAISQSFAILNEFISTVYNVIQTTEEQFLTRNTSI